MNTDRLGLGVNGSRRQFHPDSRNGPPPPRAQGAGTRLPALLSLLLALALLLLPVGTPAAWALSLPWQQPGTRPMPAPAASPARGGLQEVAPPAAVQQLQAALADREPVVEILSPHNDAVLGSGPWTLRLAVRDWPLVDAGDLGLGPHLVVQLDQEPPRIWTDLEGELPELSPGSHRLTVYAALPWGEARRNPGAVRQIRLHRTAPNPLAVPEVGSPQLLAVSPPAVAGEEPLLFDVLLLDAPLQNVGGTGTQWRLRLTINGDDMLLDQQTPLWLRGWKPGVNALQLELLDARGHPLNPPFNALVREVDRRNPPPRPRWRGGELNDVELGMLLGRIPTPPPSATPDRGPGDDRSTPTPARQGTEAAGASRTPEAATSRTISTTMPLRTDAAPVSKDAGVNLTPAAGPGIDSPATTAERQAPAPGAEGAVVPSSTGEQPTAGSTPGTDEPQGGDAAAEPPEMGGTQAGTPPRDPTRSPAIAQQPHSGSAAASMQAGPPRNREDRSLPAAGPGGGAGTPPPVGPKTPAPTGSETGRSDSGTPARPQDRGAEATTADDDGTTPPSAAVAERGRASDERPTASSPPAAVSRPPSAMAGGSGEARIAPSSSLSGRARDLVNEDGTLRRPERRGPLAALREKLQG